MNRKYSYNEIEEELRRMEQNGEFESNIPIDFVLDFMQKDMVQKGYSKNDQVWDWREPNEALCDKYDKAMKGVI